MAHITKLGALTDELITLVASFSPKDEKYNTYRESVLRSLRYSNNARTNQFDVFHQLDGLEEKFRVYNEDTLADALRSRLDELASKSAKSTKWAPEILHLLFELSDKPVFNSQLKDLEFLRPPELVTEPKLRWEDLAAEDPELREKRIWKNIDYTAESSDEESASLESGLSDSEDTQTTEISTMEEPEENFLENIIIPVNDEGLKRLLEAQFWTREDVGNRVSSKRVVPVCKITELEAIREVLFLVSGAPTSLFKNSQGSFGVKPVQHFNLEHASSDALQAMLQDSASQASSVLRLRGWTKTNQKLPLVQGLQSAIEKRLRTFDARISDLTSTYVAPRTDVVVSLLELQADLNMAVRPLIELSKTIQELESEPYSHAFRYLELLYKKICVSQMAGEAELYEFMANLFFDCFSVYLRPLRKWMEEGELKSEDTIFFVAENIHEVEPAMMWEEKFMLRKTQTGSLHAPQFLHTSANKIFTTGKSVVVLKKLGRFDTARASRTAVEPTLDFDTVCASNTLASFSELFDVAFEQWIQSKHHAASLFLRECLYRDCGLLTSLNSLDNVFFMKTPTVFPDVIFEKLDQLKPTWNDRFTLTDLARTTIGTLDNIDPDRLGASIHPSEYNDVQQDRKTVNCLSSITLLYHMPWAIQIIITPPTVAIYQNLHAFLLQTLRARTILSSLPLRASLAGPTRFAITTPEQSLHYSLRTRLLWFINIMTTYLTSNVLAISTAALKQALAAAKDVDEMITVHMKFAKKIEDQALLGTKLEPIQKNVIKILDMALRLSDLQTSFGEAPEVEIGGYTFEYSTDSVRATPVKPKSTVILTPGRYKKRRDSLSDSSNSDSERDNDRKPPISNADGGYRSLVGGDTMVDDNTGDTHLEQLRRMKTEFDSSCRFVSTGLRGVARVGGDSGAGKEWDLLAEMIEGGFGGVPWL